MEENERDINGLVNKYNSMIAGVQLPEMKVDDLLDLIDYYTRIGMDFEAELYKRIAAMKFPTDPEVVLMCAHWEADDGNWNGVKAICSTLDSNKYDEALFQMEKLLRMMMPKEAMEKVETTVSALSETADHDFLFDAAELFRDFGFMRYALDCMRKIPSSYGDYRQVMEMAAECSFYLTEYDAAIQQLDKAIDANPFDDYLWAQSALLQYKKNDNEKALDACEYALAIQKNNARAQHLKNILKWKDDDHFDVTASSYLRQDYSAMMEIGDIHYLKEDYKHAEAEYMAAGYFCPRGNRDRIQIVFKTACCRVFSGRVEEGIDTLLSSINQGFDLWPYAFEVLQMVLKKGKPEFVTRLLLPILRLDEMNVHRIEELITELMAFECYKDAKEVWEMVFKQEDKLSALFQEMVKVAKKELEK